MTVSVFFLLMWINIDYKLLSYHSVIQHLYLWCWNVLCVVSWFSWCWFLCSCVPVSLCPFIQPSAVHPSNVFSASNEPGTVLGTRDTDGMPGVVEAGRAPVLVAYRCITHYSKRDPQSTHLWSHRISVRIPESGMARPWWVWHRPSHEAAVEMSSEGLTGAGELSSKAAHLRGCWLEASAPRPVALKRGC